MPTKTIKAATHCTNAENKRQLEIQELETQKEIRSQRTAKKRYEGKSEIGSQPEILKRNEFLNSIKSELEK